MPHGEEDGAQRGARGEVPPQTRVLVKGPFVSARSQTMRATWQKVNERESDEIWLSKITLNIQSG